MRILTGGIATASFIALALGACGNDGGSASFGQGGGDSCSQFSSCSACTPVNGCGWCYNSDGTGNCAAGPDLCATATSSFYWTWNPSGCHVTAEAGVAPGGGDGSAATADGGSVAPGDALAESAPVDAMDASSATSDGAGEAASTEGGSDGAAVLAAEGGGG